MSLNTIRKIFEQITNSNKYSLQLLKINSSKRNGTSYISREITLEPAGRLKEFISEISLRYTDMQKGVLLTYSDISDYDGTAMGHMIYKLKRDDILIKEEYDAFVNAVAVPDVEIDPFDMKANAYLIKTSIQLEGEEVAAKLISMQNPITVLKHKFMRNNGKFEEIKDKVLSLRPSVDVVILGDYIYMLTLAGEKLFNMERSYKNICSKKINEIVDVGILSNNEVFITVASTGHNPRKFIAYSESRLEKLRNHENRIKMAERFSIPLSGDKFDTDQEGASEKIVKLLCNKGMVDPFEDVPVEVAAARQWR